MSITDELRKYASNLAMRVGASTYEVKGALEEIADRIDQEHEECAGFCRRLEDAASKGEEVTIFGTDYIQLPKDADGETIRIGDRLDGYNKTIEVVELRYGRSGWVLVSRDGNAYHDTAAFGHAKPDSWERIIEDVRRRTSDYYCNQIPCDFRKMADEMVERCKRLAGEDS